MIRVRYPAFDRLALALERRALRRLDARTRRARPDGALWRSASKLWPDFGDD